jgi:phenylalanyl-tRNA synthetase beta chain
MLVSLKWLADYVPLNLAPKELAERLTLAGAKVERIVNRGGDWDLIRVGRVVQIAPHPNADRLRLVTVDVNEPEQPTVVCGAPNVAVGQKIAFGAVGARVRDGHTGEWSLLKPAKIRGVDSAGMVLSEKELGLSEEHTGILELPDDAPVGEPLAGFYGDTIFDIEVTPNRPDLLSILGVAWETAAQTHVKVREPDRTYVEYPNTTAAQRTSVAIEDKDLCSRYIAGIVERVKIGPSPAWLQERLLSAGQRPINNVVDITNYVMLETGQPLHAFDYRKLGGGRIIVRRARPGERIRTLDGADRALANDMLVIADAGKPVAIAGLMGGADAEVSDATTAILLESANFNPINIRATSAGLGLRTEASVRFEKGLHPELAAVAARRAMKLLVELAGGRAAKGLVDTYAVKHPDTRVVVTRRRIEQVLGTDLSTPAVRNALTDLGFGCRWVPPDRYVVRAPYWRTDVTQADDVVEELARVTGYDRIEASPLAGALPPPFNDPVRRLRDQLKDAAVAAGAQEIITYPLTTTDLLSLVQPADLLEVHPPLRLENPMSSEMAVMRTTLRASVLQAVAANLRHERAPVALFETARAYFSRPEALPDESDVLVGAMAGVRVGRWGEPLDEPVDFYDAKGLVEDMLERAGVAVEFRAAEDYGLLRGRTATLHAGDQRFGVIGQVHPQVASRLEIAGPVFIFELDLPALLPYAGGRVRHQPLSRFPEVIQDIALIIDDKVPAAQVAAIIEANGLVSRVNLFDVYEGEPLAAGRRSLAFAVHFQSADKTLTDSEVADARRRIVRRLEHELGAELRGSA